MRMTWKLITSNTVCLINELHITANTTLISNVDKNYDLVTYDVMMT